MSDQRPSGEEGLRGRGGETRVRMLTEREMGEWRLEQGHEVRESAGRWWLETGRGFWQPVHSLARLRWEEARKPDAKAWGCQAVLDEADADRANAVWAVHARDVTQGYDESALTKSRRKQLRHCLATAAVERVFDADLLTEQGHAVYEQARSRTGEGGFVPESVFRSRMETLVPDERSVFVAALRDGRLLGYSHGYAVDGVAYLQQTVLGDDGLSCDAGTGLQFELTRLLASHSGVNLVMSGIHTPDDPGLASFKGSFGLQVLRLPSRLRVPAPLLWYLRVARPATYYRFTGRGL